MALFGALVFQDLKNNNMNNIIKRRRRFLGGVGSYTNAYSISFDGTNDYFDTGDPFTTTIRGSFTIGYWIKTTELNTSASEYHLGTFNVSGAMSYFHLSAKTDGNLLITFKGLTGSAGSWTTNSPVLDTTNGTNGNWMHIAVVVNRPGSGNISAKIYINGSEVALTNSTALSITNQASFDNTGTNLSFAAMRVGTGSTNLYHVNCKMDEIAIWNASLSDASMAVVGAGPFNLKAASGNYTNQSDLVSHWRFIEGENTSVEDATTNSDGTLVNGAAWGTDVPS